MKPNLLIFPGYGDSGPLHWQSIWERSDPRMQRLQHCNWWHPECGQWQRALEDSLREIGESVVVVAHSLACLTIAHWASVAAHATIRGAFLVAPPDPGAASFPKAAVGFSPLPQLAFDFPSVLVASTNDPYASLEFASRQAAAWGSRLEITGAWGHLNDQSGLGDWLQGRSLLESFLCTLPEWGQKNHSL
jgi:predicted alpha/beta hydrolase family esterase